LKDVINISEISAEVLLGYLYPELTGKWRPRHAGTFYRNYNNDVMALYPDEPTVVLSRDGFLQLLPKGLLNGKTNEEMKVMKEAFLPIDTFWFNNKLKVELQVSEVLQEKLHHVLREYFRIDPEKETNPYVRQSVLLLPFVRKCRGDFSFIRELISTLVHCPVTMKTGRYSDTDNTVAWLPEVRYELFIEGRTNEEYNRLRQDLQPLFDFIRLWLIPAEIVAEFEIKEHPSRTLGHTTLGYNTRLSVES